MKTLILSNRCNANVATACAPRAGRQRHTMNACLRVAAIASGFAIRVAVHLLLLTSLLTTTTVTHGFEKLTAAQALVYDTPHLQNTRDGQTLTYQYNAVLADQDSVTDRALLSVANAGDDGKRDVTVDFLTDERRLVLPEFAGYRGNPIIIAMLEHIAQTLGDETGGGVLYFRNRIRDGLAAESVSIAESEIEVGATKVAATQVNFSPFENDPYLMEMPRYSQSNFTISLSEDVPGGVVGIRVISQQGDVTHFQRDLTLDLL